MALLKAKVAGEWVEVGYGPSYPLRHPLWSRPVTYSQTLAGDVIEYYGGYFMWTNASQPPTAWPLSAEAGWVLIGGTPILTTAQLAAWTGAAVGDICYVAPASTTPAEVVRRLVVKTPTVWRYADMAESSVASVSGINPLNAAGELIATVSGRPMAASGIMRMSGQVWLQRVGGTSGNVTLCFLINWAGAPGSVEVQVARGLMDNAGNPDLTLSAAWSYPFPATTSLTVQMIVRRLTGDVTYRTFGDAYRLQCDW